MPLRDVCLKLSAINIYTVGVATLLGKTVPIPIDARDCREQVACRKGGLHRVLGQDLEHWVRSLGNRR